MIKLKNNFFIVNNYLSLKSSNKEDKIGKIREDTLLLYFLY